MRDQHVDILGNVGPLVGEFMVILEEGLAIEIGHPGSTKKHDIAKLETRTFEEYCIAERPVRVECSLLQLKIMVSARADDQLKILPAKPVIQSVKVLIRLIEHVEHVAAVDKHVARQGSKVFLFSMGVADNGKFQCCAL